MRDPGRLVSRAPRARPDRSSDPHRRRGRAHRTILRLVLAHADARALGTGTGEVSESLAEACNAVRTFYPDVTLAVQVREETLTVAISASLLVRLFTNVARNAMHKVQDDPGNTADGRGEKEAPGHEVPDKNERPETNER